MLVTLSATATSSGEELQPLLSSSLIGFLLLLLGYLARFLDGGKVYYHCWTYQLCPLKWGETPVIYVLFGYHDPRNWAFVHGSLTVLFVLVSWFRRFYVTISHNFTFRVSSESYSVGKLELFHLLSVWSCWYSPHTNTLVIEWHRNPRPKSTPSLYSRVEEGQQLMLNIFDH